MEWAYWSRTLRPQRGRGTYGNGTRWMPGMKGPNPAPYTYLEEVRASAPVVRPWKPPVQHREHNTSLSPALPPPRPGSATGWSKAQPRARNNTTAGAGAVPHTQAIMDTGCGVSCRRARRPPPPPPRPHTLEGHDVGLPGGMAGELDGRLHGLSTRACRTQPPTQPHTHAATTTAGATPFCTTTRARTHKTVSLQRTAFSCHIRVTAGGLGTRCRLGHREGVS